MGRGKFKAKPTGRRQFSTPEEISAGTSARPRTFRKLKAQEEENEVERSEEEQSEEDSDNDSQSGFWSSVRSKGTSQA